MDLIVSAIGDICEVFICSRPISKNASMKTTLYVSINAILKNYQDNTDYIYGFIS
jgi:hypothetical protein